MNFDEIAEDLAFLEDWEARLEYVIDLGKQMPKLEESEMTSAYKVEGCASNVWLVPEVEGEKLQFRGGSDALIVSGIIAVLLARVSGKTPNEILEINVKEDFDNLGLSAHLSSQRSNGLAAMIDRIRHIAENSI